MENIKEEFKCTRCLIIKESSLFPYGKGVRHCWCRECNNTTKREARRLARKTTNPRKIRIAEDYTTKEGLIICAKCKKEYPPQNYQNKKGGGWCRVCRTNKEKERRKEKGIDEKKFSVIIDDKKLCMCCGRMKLFKEFPTCNRGKGGLGAYCRPCHKDRYYDPIKAREACRKYRERHREKHLSDHRIRMWEYNNRKKVTSDGSVTEIFLISLYSTTACYYCKKDTPLENRTVDHKIALANGGKHIAENLVMACWSCNCSKQDKTEEAFLKVLNNNKFSIEEGSANEVGN